MKIVKRFSVKRPSKIDESFSHYFKNSIRQSNLKGLVNYDEEYVQLHIEGEALDVYEYINKMSESFDIVFSDDDVINDELRTAKKKMNAHQPNQYSVFCPHCIDLLFNQLEKRFYNAETLYNHLITYVFYKNNIKELIDHEASVICSNCKKEGNMLRQLNRLISNLNDGLSYYILYEGEKISGIDAFKKFVQLVEKGTIVAVKGLGGYHLLCDASNNDAIKTLREKIRRKRKPFAVMVNDIKTARLLAHISEEEENQLKSNIRPIVLVRSKHKVAEQVALQNKNIGIFLPYLPIHHFIFQFNTKKPIIMTSANLPSEPTMIDDENIKQFMNRLNGAVFLNDRKIEKRTDDSVVKITHSEPIVIRRSRGFPKKLPLKIYSKKPILTLGADLKGSVTLINNGDVWFSNFLGNLTNYKAQINFEHEVNKLIEHEKIRLRDIIIGHDLHPEFFTTQFSERLGGYKRIAIQHHHAHIASMLVDQHQMDKKVVGIAFDGTGYGEDGTIWGGEIFVGTVRRGFKRYGHLKRANLIGGDAAAKFPIQALAGFFPNQINRAKEIGERLHFPERFFTSLQLMEKEIATFKTTSVGRLFDAVAALLGFHRENSFEGEAAIWLEHLAYEANSSYVYPFPWENNKLNYEPLIMTMAKDLLKGVSPSVIAKSFHRTLATRIDEMISDIKRKENIQLVILAGGVFQNSLLLESLKKLLKNKNIELITGYDIPMNDESISLGQAIIISQRFSHDTL